MLFLLFFALFSQNVMGFQTDIWKGGNYEFYYPNGICDGSFHLSIDYNAGNVSFPNIITVSNYIYGPNCTYDTSYLTLYNWERAFSFDCPNATNGCVTPFPNCPVNIILYNDFDVSGATYVNDGIIFLSNGTIPTFSNPCSNVLESVSSNGIAQFCYTDVEYIDIKDVHEEMCNEFESTGVINYFSPDFTVTFDIKYVLHIDTIKINITILWSGISCGSWLIIDDVMYQTYISGNGERYLEWEFPKSGDFQYEFIMYSGCVDFIWYVPVGELTRRNGIYIHDLNIPYTSKNPCWTRIDEDIYPYGASFNVSFCCTNFESATPTTSTLSTIVPSSLPPTDNPISDSYGTLCSTDTSKAWLDIIFVVDIATSMSSKSLMQLSGEIATTLQKFTFSQNGDHTTRAGIIIYGSNFTTLFELNNVTNFVAFEKVLLSLSKYYDSHDYGSNVYGALDAAYRLLQIQKSHRLPVIVLVSATYNASGFKGTSELSKNIKGNGTNIVGINFSPKNSDLTKALQNIVSPGYYFDSSQQDLYLNLGYAFSQLNCICPSGSKQFRSYNPSWNNYTNFADCLYGVNGDTEPSIANMICNSDNGILVSLPNPEIFSFITDNIIPYDLLGVKKFSIGLHKSDFDGLWKWWNYDGSETLKGDYPNMSTEPAPSDNYGYMWNYNGFKWKLQTGNDIPLPYICQKRACDAENFCDSLKNI